MATYYLNHQSSSLLGRYVWKSHQSGMGNVMQIYQLPKVRIDRDQYPAIRFCKFQQRPVPRIGAKLPSFHNVMSITAEPLRKTMACTPVYEESHELATDTAANESPAMTACA